MRLLKAVAPILFVLVLASAGAGQGSSKVVKVSPGESVYKAKKGATTQIAVALDIDAGYHINSNRPTDKNLIATNLKIEKTAGFTTTLVSYPRAKMKKFQFSPKPLSVFEGRILLVFGLRTLATAASGQQTIRGKLTVQACNDEACLRPQTIDVAIPVEVF